jgi:release factor glutamine methyltransferase
VATLLHALDYAVNCLRDHQQPRLEAEVLLAHVLDKPRSYLYAWPEAELSEVQESRFVTLVQQRAAGQPVAYLTGHREFWSLDIQVTADTLIPRPETELLVEQTVALLPERETLRVADLGTGSGAIALALARQRANWQLYAVDRHRECLNVARGNARRLGLDNLAFIQGDWCRAFAGQSLDAIVSNPPYVAERDPHLSQGDVRFEPESALTSGPKGLDDLEKLITAAPRVLKPAALILLEHAPEQTEEVHNMLISIDFNNISTARDLAGLERATSAFKPT